MGALGARGAVDRVDHRRGRAAVLGPVAGRLIGGGAAWTSISAGTKSDPAMLFGASDRGSAASGR